MSASKITKNRKRLSSTKLIQNSKIKKGDLSHGVDKNIDECVEGRTVDRSANTQEHEENEEEFRTTGSFSMKKFREQLKSNDFIKGIRHFLQEATSNSDLIGKYVNIGGKPLELVETLERIDNSQLFHVSYIFQITQLILIEILSTSTHLTQVAIQSCSYLLNKHRTCIESLLNSRNGSHRRSVLKLLTAIVALEPQFGREILSTMSVVFNPETLEQFTRHLKADVDSGGDNVRTCYIHFVMAYLIEGNVMLVRNILDRNELIMAVLSGLIYDSQETVCLVLGTLLRFILKSAHVSKTKKVQVFNADILTKFVALFEWKGPSYFVAMLDKKNKDNVEHTVDENELELVSKATFEFLNVLLCSRKYGIAFQCLGFQRIKKNNTQRVFLSVVARPWKNTYKANLAIDVLKACPELSRVALKRYNYFVNVKQKVEFYESVDWFCKMVEQMTPNVIRTGAEYMSASEMVQLIETICMGPEILQKLAVDSTLRNENIKIRYAASRLLHAMFGQCNHFLFALNEWNIYSQNDMRKIKFDIINHIFVCSPSVQQILISLHMTLKKPEQDLMLNHLESVLDLLLIIAKSIPSFIEASSSVMNYMKILQPIYGMNRNHESSTRIELKAVQLILAMEPKALSVNTPLFNEVVDSFMNVFIFGKIEEQNETRSLLRNVFENTGFFENGILEIDLWLESLTFIQKEELPVVKKFLIDALVTYDANNVPKLVSVQISNGTNDVKNVEELFYNIENGLTLNGIMDMPTLSNFFVHAVAKLNQEVIDSVLRYIENVGFLLFHYQPEPKSIQSVMKTLNHKYGKYMKHWINNGKLGKLQEHQFSILVKLYDAMVSGQQSFVDVFQSTSSGVRLLINGSDTEVDPSLMNESQVMIFVYICMFIVIHLNEQGNFNEHFSIHCTSYLKCLIEVLHQLWSNQSKNMKPGFEVDRAHNTFIKSLQYIFGSRFYFLKNFNIWENISITYLIVELTIYITTLNNKYLDDILIHYRTKITNQIEQAVMQSLLKENEFRLPSESGGVIHVLNVFSLKHDHLVTIIESITKLSTHNFSTQPQKGTIFYDILGFTLKRVAELKEKALSSEDINNICRIYIAAIRQSNDQAINERFEDAIWSYLKVFYHSIGSVHDEVFTAILNTGKPSKLTIKVATIVLERNKKFTEIVIQLLPKLITKKELIYPLLNVIANRSLELDPSLLSSMYGEFKNGIMKTIEKPQKAGVIYKENIFSTLFLIEQCMPLNECVDFAKKTIKFDSAEVYQLQIIKAIHLKALTSDKREQRESVFMNFVNIFVQLFSMLLKKDNLDYEKINGFAVIISQWLNLRNNHPNSQTERYQNIINLPLWSVLGRTCLKIGIHSDTTNDSSSVLLKLFGFLCDNFYPNNCENVEPAKLYDMALSHSAFLDLALQSQPTDTKTYLMYTLFVLLKKNQSSIKSSHVPVFLGAYQAKLSKCDQWILAILQKYEQCDVKMHEFRPFMWGESAVSYYSLREIGIKSNLNQESPMMQMMSIIDPSCAEKTLSNFPIWRKLDATTQVPHIEFNYYRTVGSEHLGLPNIATNRLEKCVMNKEFDPELSDMSYRKQETYDEVYDPAFFIPLMSKSFAPEEFTRPVRPAQNGLLAITFAALSSKDKALRLATGSALQRYRSHLESARFIDNKIWVHLFDCIQNGLKELTVEMRKTKKSRIPRVPYISGIFLARTINILMNPLNELYRPITSFITLQSSFNFLDVPEFNVLFNSPNMNHVSYRHFILEIIRDGIKCASDFTILISQNIFKAILGFYNTPMATLETNLLILRVINVAVKIPSTNRILIQKIGLLSWMNFIVDNVDFFQFDIIDGLCNIFNSLWFSLKYDQRKYNNINEIELRLFSIMLKLVPNISTRTDFVAFTKFLNVFVHVIHGNFHFLTEANIDHLISCAKVHLTENVLNLSLIKESNETYCESLVVYVRQLRELGINETMLFIEVTMREVINGWLKSKKV